MCYRDTAAITLGEAPQSHERVFCLLLRSRSDITLLAGLSTQVRTTSSLTAPMDHLWMRLAVRRCVQLCVT
ncbi:hypothetical protein ACKKBG_A08670 [Auxenochlorella protothecoides x Auxenochlorella symbiontica]